MKKYLQEFILNLENKLEKNYKFSIEEKNNIQIQIAIFQHERLIHLLVTLFYALFALILIFLSFDITIIFIVPFFIVLIFLLFYVKHYFFLENSVQYLYKLYDKINTNSKPNKI